MKVVIEKDINGFYVAKVDGKEITKQNNIVAASKKLYAYLKGQSK